MKYGYSYGVSITTGTGSSGGGFSNVNSFSFDGIDDYFLGTSTYSELDGLDNFALSFWIKPSTLVGYRLILSIGTNNADYRAQQIQIASNNGKIQVYVSNMSYYFTSTVSLTQDVWQHILVTRDSARPIGAKGKVYINSVDSSSSDNTRYWSQSALSNSGLMIGKHNNSYGSVFNGNIDEVAIYTQDMASYVSEIYGGGQAVDLNNLATAPQPTTWQRMGEDATWNGATWTMTDVNGGYVNRSINMIEANRTTDVPPNPFTNLNSFSFDGVDDYFMLPSAITLVDDFSVSMWVKSTTSGSVRDQVFGGGSGFFLFSTVVFNGGANANKMTYYNGSSYVALTPTIRDGQWHNIVITYNSSATNLIAYTDGVETYNATYDAGTNNVIDRISEDTYGNYWKGNLDELAVWQTELSQSDVTAIYNNGEPQNLDAYSPFVWFRLGDNATWNGATWTMTSVGTDTRIARSINMVEANRTTDVPFNYKSIALDGVDDYVDLGASSTVADNGQFSFSFWIKGGNVPSGGQTYLFSADYYNLHTFWVLQNNNLQWMNVNGTRFNLSVGVLDNSWHHILIVWNPDGANSTIRCFTDGGNEVNVSTDWRYGTGGIYNGVLRYIGNRGGGSYNGLNGNIDEFAIWDDDQSANVSAIYNSGQVHDLNALSSPPVNWYRMGDGDTSPTLTDNGTGGNDGTMTNFTTFSTDVPT